MSDTNPGEPGWQADPSGKHDHRYWDGSQWTENVSDAGVASTDPYLEATAEPAAADPGPTDPTVSEPVVAAAGADPTSAWSSGGPPPPVPVAAAATDEGGGGGGSKKGLLIGGGILVIVAIIVAVLALGGSDDDNSDDLQAQLATSIGRSTGISNDDADCVADYLIDNVDHDTLAGLDFDSNDKPAVISDDLDDAAVKCGLTSGDGSTTTTDSSDDSTTTTDSSGGTGGTGTQIPDAVRDSIVSGLETAGLTSDQAECVTDKMIDAYESGDISESDFTTNYLDFFADCDIDPNSLGN